MSIHGPSQKGFLFRKHLVESYLRLFRSDLAEDCFGREMVAGTRLFERNALVPTGLRHCNGNR